MSTFKRGLRYILLLLGSLLLVFMLLDFFRAPSAPADFATHSLHTIDGRDVTLAELSDKKPMLVYFWGSWCGICRHISPHIDRLHARGFNVLSVALRSGDDIRVVQYLNGAHLSMPVVNDPQGEMASAWEVNVTPTILIISKGEVVQTTIGWTSYAGLRLRLWWAQKWH